MTLAPRPSIPQVEFEMVDGPKVQEESGTQKCQRSGCGRGDDRGFDSWRPAPGIWPPSSSTPHFQDNKTPRSGGEEEADDRSVSILYCTNIKGASLACCDENICATYVQLPGSPVPRREHRNFGVHLGWQMMKRVI